MDLDMDACRNAFKYDLGFDEIDTILDPCHQKGIIGDLEEGLVTADEFRKYVLERSREGATDVDVNEAFAKILVGIEPSKIELLKKLAEDYDIYMLSNNNAVALPYSRRMFEKAGFSMETSFKKCFISYEMKMLKPSEAFYKAVMKEIGLPASEMIFIDDSQKNVDAAIAAGLPAAWYDPGTDLAAVVYAAINA